MTMIAEHKTQSRGSVELHIASEMLMDDVMGIWIQDRDALCLCHLSRSEAKRLIEELQKFVEAD